MIITNSERATFCRCPRLWYYKYKLLKDKKAFNQNFYEGSGYHYAMEIFFLPDTTLPKLKSRLLEYLEPNEFKLSGVKLAVIRARIKAMLAATWKKWEPVRHEYRHIESELTLMVPFGPEGDFITGQLDYVIEHIPTGKLFLLDWKTSGEDVEKSQSDYWIRMAFDNQIRHYKFMYEKKYKKPIGVMYGVIKKPVDKELKTVDPETGKKKIIRRRKFESDMDLQIRKEQYQESIISFESRLNKQFEKDFDSLCFIKHIPTPKSRQINWSKNMWQTILNIKSCEANESYPQNDKGCRMYGSLCAFFNVCSGLQSIDDPEFVTKPAKHMELEDRDIKENDKK